MENWHNLSFSYHQITHICSTGSLALASFTKYTSHVMRKPVYAECKQQRRRSTCTSMQSDQHLCCSLPGWYNTSTCYIGNFKPLAGLCCWTGRFDAYLVANPEAPWRGSYNLRHKANIKVGKFFFVSCIIYFMFNKLVIQIFLEENFILSGLLILIIYLFVYFIFCAFCFSFLLTE